MAFFKRISLFLIVNILIITTINVLLHVLGFKGYLTERGIDYPQLMLLCFVWGMAGSVISLFLSKVMAKFMMGVQIIDPGTHDPSLRMLVDTVHQQAKMAGLSKMPEVGIFDSPAPNAFATGPSRNNALVAVSTGLLSRMNRDQIEGVLGHELTHIANGDMVTMTLLQGIVNAFVLFLSKAIAFAIASGSRGDEREGRAMSGGAYFVVEIILQIVFSILGSIVVAWFSRQREFRADAGGGRLAGRDKMISALEALKRLNDGDDDPMQKQAPALATLQISGKTHSFLQLFSTHPPLEDRIARLQY